MNSFRLVRLSLLLLATFQSLVGPCFALSISPMSDVAVVGCGVLGTSLCRQLVKSPDFKSKAVTGITKTSNRHKTIREQVGDSENFSVKTSEEVGDQKFRDVVFCAPPSGFDDYPAAVKDAVSNVWAGPSAGGSFIFTSSGGIYGSSQDGGVVNESSPTADLKTNPRSARLVNAEKVCLENGGCCLRLAGLYTLERGAHNYWLTDEGKEVAGRSDGVVNLLHYDDAAAACLAALHAGPSVVSSRVFLISDGNPTTRKGICESAKKAKLFADKVMPTFLGDGSDPLGKVYDGSVSNEALKWTPKFESFDEFMTSHS